MTRDVFAVTPETSLMTAAHLLANRHISAAPVIDPAGRVLGVISQLDLVDPDRDRTDRLGTSIFYRRAAGGLEVAHGEVPVTAEGLVRDVMSPYVLAVDADAPLLDAVRLMVADDVHRLLVLERGRLSGIVSQTDVMRALLQVADEAAATAPKAVQP
jgi:CBS domain-containing protein